MKIIQLLCLLLVCCQVVKGQQLLYVSESGSDANTGTSTTTAFKTLKKAHDAIPTTLTQSYVVNLNGKIHTSDAECDEPLIWKRSGTSAYSITIKSLNNSSPATIERVNVENSHKSSFILVLQEANYITIQDLIFNDASAGISVDRCSDVSITNCKFYIDYFAPTGGAGAITIGAAVADTVAIQSHNIQVTNNTIEFRDERVMDRCWKTEGGEWNCFDLYHGIYLAHANNCLIDGNTIKNAPGGAIHTFHNYTTNNDITNNHFYLCYNHGYSLPDTKYGETRAVDPTRHAVILAGVDSVYGNNISDNTVHSSTLLKITRAEYTAIDLWEDDVLDFHDSLNFIVVPSNHLGDNSFNSNEIVQFTCPNSAVSAYQGRYNKRYEGNRIEIYDFNLSNEMFVVIKDSGTILKMKEESGQGPNMFRLDYENGEYNSLQGNDFLLGSQNFEEEITDLEYVGGYTLIGFKSGRILKIEGTGGDGGEMFGTIIPNQYGFSSTSSHYVGSHKFLSAICDITSIGNYTFISFEGDTSGVSKKMLKVSGSGGEDSNLFAITETNNSFSGNLGYNYYVGYGVFNGKVTNVTYNLGEMLIGFDNGKLLKISGTGSSGANMFAVNETTNGFTTVSGYNYYRGSAKFMGNVTKILPGSNIVVCFSDGKILKISGNGGSGDNLFAVTETATDFAGLSGYNYYIGDARYPGHVTDIVHSNGYTYMALNTGRLYRIGSTGDDVFGGECPQGYDCYYEEFFSTITDIAVVNDSVYVSLMDDKILKFSDNATGGNMFNIVETGDDYLPDCNYSQRLFGTQLLGVSSGSSGGRLRSASPPEAMMPEEHERYNEFFNVFPNPSHGEFRLKLANKKDEINLLQIFNVYGREILHYENFDPAESIKLEDHNSGIYLMCVRSGKHRFVKKIILEK